ncbi:MAG: RHS repeat-associated core domain-containing protein, partial [Exiguobacterium sp.]|nr:RHS repeat-associated core domain-containing protein [Exiguobacterium sp.]
KRNGTLYVPHADAYGNIFRYTDTEGNVVAEYAYDAFGRTISRSGTMSDVFRHRFSTKYCDTETGLYYYGCRFYHPALMRWLNRDPIEEDGGLNLYGFCGNNAVSRYDKDGRAFFIKRSMFGLLFQTAQRDIDNQEWAHEQLIFEDGNDPSDVGYFNDNKIREDAGWQNSTSWVRVPGHFNDCVMRKAVQSVQPIDYKLRGAGHYNCQDYADALRAKYNELIKDKEIRCECGLDSGKKGR